MNENDAAAHKQTDPQAGPCWHLAKCVTGGSVLLVYGDSNQSFPYFEATEWVDLSAVAVALTMTTAPIMEYRSVDEKSNFNLTYLKRISPDKNFIIDILCNKSIKIGDSNTPISNCNLQSIASYLKTTKGNDYIAEFVKLINVLERL